MVRLIYILFRRMKCQYRENKIWIRTYKSRIVIFGRFDGVHRIPGGILTNPRIYDIISAAVIAMM